MFINQSPTIHQQLSRNQPNGLWPPLLWSLSRTPPKGTILCDVYKSIANYPPTILMDLNQCGGSKYVCTFLIRPTKKLLTHLSKSSMINGRQSNQCKKRSKINNTKMITNTPKNIHLRIINKRNNNNLYWLNCSLINQEQSKGK